jgi:subtilisin
VTWTPAWAWQFAEGHRSEVEGLGLAGPISRDWAWGGATGAGVKVAVIDSGVEDGHPAVGRLAGAVAVEIDWSGGPRRTASSTACGSSAPT